MCILYIHSSPVHFVGQLSKPNYGPHLQTTVVLGCLIFYLTAVIGLLIAIALVYVHVVQFVIVCGGIAMCFKIVCINVYLRCILKSVYIISVDHSYWQKRKRSC